MKKIIKISDEFAGLCKTISISENRRLSYTAQTTYKAEGVKNV